MRALAKLHLDLLIRAQVSQLSPLINEPHSLVCDLEGMSRRSENSLHVQFILHCKLKMHWTLYHNK